MILDTLKLSNQSSQLDLIFCIDLIFWKKKSIKKNTCMRQLDIKPTKSNIYIINPG